MADFADHFSQLAARYATYRPHYPAALIDALADRCARRDLAWDVGCGNGQLSVALAARFARVIATDPAQAQLDHAEPAPGVEYRCERSEASSLAPASADLAVAAQAAHWFDWPRFVAEVGRVVRPGGVVALATYRNAELAGPAGERLAAFYRELEPHWPGGRTHVLNDYRDLTMPWPEPGASAVAVPREMTATWTRDELLGYASTWSATSHFIAAGGAPAIAAMHRDITALWPDNEPRVVRWPLTVKLARR